MSAVCLEDLVVGQGAELRHTVTGADIDAFAAATGDHNPVHMDEAYAKQTVFGGRVAHGFLSAAYISAILGNQLPGPGTIYVSQKLRFLRPVRIGDEVTTRVAVKAIDQKSGHVTFATACLVRNKRVIDGEAVVIAPRRGA